MSRPALLFTLLALLSPAACASAAPAARTGEVDTPAAPPPSPDERARSEYSDRTLLYYDPSHGNQIEYTGPDGRAFLWYPGNRSPLPGGWRVDAQRICFQYDEDSYNPATGEIGGAWECTPLELHRRDVVDSAPGDVFGLTTGNLPFRLPAQPPFGSISNVKAATPR